MILVAVGALGPGSLPGGATRASRLACVGVHLPAPVTITTGRISFRIARDCRIRRTRNARSSFPRAAAWFPSTGTWYEIQHGHLVVGRGRTSLWRSHGEIASRDQLGVIIASSHMVAFQHDHKLYLVRLRGAERPVAKREMPLGWTSGGLYTYRYGDRQLLLRSDSGALVKTIARHPLGSDYFVAGGRLYFIVHGVLMSARGPRIRRLGSLASLRMPDPWLQPVGRLLELEDNSRLVVLRSNGSLFAWAPLPRDDGHPESLSSSLIVAPDASALAFTAAAGESDNPDAAQRAHGTETVYVLWAGAQTATAVHTERVAFRACARGASVQWHRKWLLYSTSEGNLAAIDTTGAHRAIELSSLARSLPGTREGSTAYWASRPPEP